MFPSNTLWLCMSPGCGYYGCGRRDNAHSRKHHKLTGNFSLLLKFKINKLIHKTGHPLHIKLNTLEMWCHTCRKWTGDDLLNDHIVEIERASEIRKKIVNFTTHWNAMDEKEFERRKMVYI